MPSAKKTIHPFAVDGWPHQDVFFNRIDSGGERGLSEDSIPDDRLICIQIYALLDRTMDVKQVFSWLAETKKLNQTELDAVSAWLERKGYFC